MKMFPACSKLCTVLCLVPWFGLWEIQAFNFWRQQSFPRIEITKLNYEGTESPSGSPSENFLDLSYMSLSVDKRERENEQGGQSLSSATAAMDQLQEWVKSLRGIERSDPEWVGDELLTISTSGLMQEHLESLMPPVAPVLFPTEWARAKLDFDWRCCLLRHVVYPSGINTSYQNTGEDKSKEVKISKQLQRLEEEEILSFGKCNSHPLRLQLVAIPPHTELALHVHPAWELDIPLLGTLFDRYTDTIVSRDMLCRRPEHSIGTPLSAFSASPTPDELLQIHEDLSSRVVLQDQGDQGAFSTRTIAAGECLVNPVGSVHQSFTGDEPCLLWVLGPNVHAHFQPGNFHQRHGIEDLTGIGHLLLP